MILNVPLDDACTIIDGEDETVAGRFAAVMDKDNAVVVNVILREAVDRNTRAGRQFQLAVGWNRGHTVNQLRRGVIDVAGRKQCIVDRGRRAFVQCQANIRIQRLFIVDRGNRNCCCFDLITKRRRTTVDGSIDFGPAVPVVWSQAAKVTNAVSAFCPSGTNRKLSVARSKRELLTETVPTSVQPEPVLNCHVPLLLTRL